MAWYTASRLRYRGRLFEVTMRYGRFMSAELLAGKPLSLREKDLRKIDKLTGRGRAGRELRKQAEYICSL
jgi:hypothetical protein